MPLALRELAAATDQSRLWRCAKDAVDLIREVSQQGAVPNWIVVHPSGWTPSDLHPAVSGYDALRIPLWLFWSGSRDLAMALSDADRSVDCTDSNVRVATVLDLASRSVLEASTSAGYLAVEALSRCGPMRVPAYVTGQTYYPATLHLLAMVAGQEADLRP